MIFLLFQDIIIIIQLVVFLARSSDICFILIGVTNAIQDVTADDRKLRQEQLKREKEAKMKAMDAAQKQKLQEMLKKQEEEDQATAQIISMKLRTMKSQMVGQAWSKRAKEKELEKAQMNIKKEKLSKIQIRERGTYNKTDPLHICETNANCHRRDSTPQRCCVHGINKEEMQKKQRVIHLSILYTPFNLSKDRMILLYVFTIE